MEKNVKKLSGIKLNQLSMNELDQRKMNVLRGGSECACIGCYCTGSTTVVITREPVNNEVHSSQGGSYD